MLSEKRASDRQKMAEQLAALAEENGATAEIKTNWAGQPRCIMVAIRAARGLCVGVDFDGESPQPDVFCLPWHVQDSDACLSEAFGGRQFSSVNPHHFAKCTAFAHGFAELLEMVRVGLQAARDGWAFDAEREAEKIAKNGTAADQALMFATWRQSEGLEPMPEDPAQFIAQAEAFERSADRWDSGKGYARNFPSDERARTVKIHREQAAELRRRAAEAERAAA